MRQHASSLPAGGATGAAVPLPLAGAEAAAGGGSAARDYRHVLRALRYANVPAVNSLDACLLFADRAMLVRALLCTFAPLSSAPLRSALLRFESNRILLGLPPLHSSPLLSAPPPLSAPHFHDLFVFPADEDAERKGAGRLFSEPSRAERC